jgi:hypothetical protein
LECKGRREEESKNEKMVEEIHVVVLSWLAASQPLFPNHPISDAIRHHRDL